MSEPLDAFDDKTTNVAAIPCRSPTDVDNTVPIDITEMERAAKDSRLVPDPDTSRIIRRPATPNPDDPYAKIRIAGAGDEVLLIPRTISPTGVALEIPAGVSVTVVSGAVVMVGLHLANGAGELQLRANVGHLREASGTASGGLSLRWDTTHPATQESIEQLPG